jgi:hypothetical protein
MNKAPKSTSALPGRTMKDWSTKGIKGYVMLMVEFLRISPSYELARQISSKGLDKKTQNKLITELYESEGKTLSAIDKQAVIAEFQTVLTTYDEFGDIATMTFDDWWQARGIYIYGTPFSKPLVKQITRIEKDEDFEPLFYKPYEQYLTKIRSSEGNPTSLILGLPLGMPKADLLRQVSKLIDNAKVPLATKSARASKALAAKRLRSEPLFIQLRILMAKAQYPDMQLWKVGLWAKVSAKHAKTLDLKESKKKFEDADSKEHLAILTSRAFKNAKQVAENAARGSFPSSKPVTLPNYDFEDIYSRLRLHYKTLKPR